MGINIKSYRNKNKKTVLSEINITPLVDVMLVLLIIFMVTSPMLVSGVEVDLPESSANNINMPEEPLTISLDKEGNIYIIETKVPMESLIEKLVSITGHKYDKKIYVRGDRNISYGKIMELIGKINAAGFKQVSLITNITSNEK